jgi:hypothetical protein
LSESSTSFRDLGRRPRQERKQAQRELGEKVLASGKKWARQLDWRQVALQHCTGLVRETSLEGYPSQASRDAAARFLDVCMANEGLFFSTGISKQVLGQMKAALEQMSRFNQMIPEEQPQAVPGEVIEKTACEMLQGIDDAFKRGEPVYLPFGYRHGSSNQGHAIACKARLDGDHVILSTFNLGNGSEVNPILNYTMHQKRPAFSSLPIRIPKDVFFGKGGHAALCHLLRYQCDAPLPGKSYQGSDINDVMLELSQFPGCELMTQIEKGWDAYESEYQISGNCSEVAARCVLEDVLITRGISKIDQKKFLLNYKFFSLISAYHAAQDPRAPSTAREILHDAAKSFCSDLLVLFEKGEIREEELIAAKAAAHEILRSLKKDPPPEEIEMPVRKREIRFDFPPLPSLEPNRQVEERPPPPLEQIEFERPLLQPGPVAPQLRKWAIAASRLPPGIAFEYVSECIRALPIPVREREDEQQLSAAQERSAEYVPPLRVVRKEKEDLWQEIPPEDARESIGWIEELVRIGLRGVKVATPAGASDSVSSPDHRFAHQFLMIYGALAISDKLARRSPESRLKGFDTPFLPPQHRFAPHGFSSLPLEEDNRRYTEIFEYLMGERCLSEQVERREIFPVAPLLDVSKFAKAHLDERYTQETAQGANHIAFLSRHLESSGRSEKIVAAEYQELWKNLRRLPRQIGSLYYMVFLSFALFSSAGKEFPATLEFEDEAIQGTPGIKLPFLEKKKENDKEEREKPFELTLFSDDQKPVAEPVKDSRFEEYETVSSFDLSDPALEKLSVNDAVCFSYGNERRDQTLSEAEMRRVLGILVKKNLSPWIALEEFSSRDRLHLLYDPTIRKTLERAFFQPRFLIERLSQERGPLVAAFREFIRNGLEHFGAQMTRSPQESTLSVLLFLIRLGVCFETFNHQMKEKEIVLSSYSEAIRILIWQPFCADYAADLRLHRGWIEFMKPSVNHAEGFKYHFANALDADLLSSNLSSWLPRELPRLIQKAALDHEKILSNPEKRNFICNQIVAYVTEDDLRREWRGTFPQYHSGELMIDFSRGTVCNLKYQAELKRGPDWIHHSQRETFLPHCWTDREGNLISLDGQWKLTKSKRLFRLSEPNLGRIEEIECPRIPEKEAQRRGQGFLTSSRFVVSRNQDGSAFVFETGSKIPFLRIERKENAQTYVVLDEEGRPTPLQLANLSAANAAHPLYSYTTRYANPDHIFCMVDENKRIQKLNFYHAGLTFLRTEKGLESQEHRGFCLVGSVRDLPEEAAEEYGMLIKEIGDFRYAMILYDPDSKKWKVLVPQTEWDQKQRDFSREIAPLKDAKISHYSEFQFDPEAQSLRPLDEDGSGSLLYLAMIFKMGREYEKANKYLSKIKAYRPIQQRFAYLLERFSRIPDHSVNSVAFNLKLSLLILRNRNLMTEPRFDSSRAQYTMAPFFDWAMKNYEAYLHMTEAGGSARIPENLRLSEAEAKLFLLSFREYYRDLYKGMEDEGEKEWRKRRPILDVQYNVLFNPKRTIEISMDEEIVASPPVLSRVLQPHNIWISSAKIIECCRETIAPTRVPEFPGELEIPPFPVQLGEHAIAHGFPLLYEAARRCPPDRSDPFDFTLHALLKRGSYAAEDQLASLLFWVRHFSDLFQDVSLEGANPGNIDRYEGAIQKIRERVATLRQTQPDRLEQVFRRKIEGKKFHVKKAISVSSPASVQERRPLRQMLPANLNQVELRKFVQETEQRIQKMFHSPFKETADRPVPPEMARDEFLFGLQKDAGQVLSFPRNVLGKRLAFGHLPETLMKEVILKNDAGFLVRHRPMITEGFREELCRLVVEWHHAKVLLKMKEEGTEHLYIPFDYQKYPEILFYYLNTGKFPRREQLETFAWIADGLASGRSRHFQLPTGAGKTDLMIPLVNLAAKRSGLMPVTCVPQSIYPVDKENLGYNLSTLGQDLCYLEVGLHMIHTLTTLDLKFIYSQLVQYNREGRSLLITRNTYDALFLLRDMTCRAGSSESLKEDERANRIRWTQEILKFFEEECLLIADESHQIADPMTRAILGVGEFTALPKREARHLLQLMKPILGRDPTRGAPSEEEIERTRRQLAARYFDEYFSDEEAERAAFLKYFTQRNAEEPNAVKRWAGTEKEKADKAALTRYFLLHLLPEVLSKTTGIDHDRSLYPERKHDVPCHNGQPTTAEYEDQRKACALTIKGTFHRGLDASDLKALLEKMIQAHELEQKGLRRRNLDTVYNQRLREWLRGTPLEGLTLEGIDFSNRKQMGELIAHLGKNPNCIEAFLDVVSFDGIGAPSRQISCSVSDVFNGFRRCVAFSATPLDDDAYPSCFEKDRDFRSMPEFRRKAIERMKDPRNRTEVVIDDASQFFPVMAREHRDLFQGATVLIDPRGFLSPARNLEVAKEWMKHNPTLDGVLYIHEERESASIDRQEKICLLLKGREEPLELQGSNIPEGFKHLGLDWETLKVGTLYDPSRTESTNIQQKPDATALFLPWEGLRTKHAIQAVSRLRGFLSEPFSQRIVWVFQKDLGRKIFKSNDHVQDFLDWTNKAEQEREAMQIVMNAFQEISYAIGRRARLEIRAAFEASKRNFSLKMKPVTETYQKYARGLEEESVVSAYELFGHPEILKNTREVLLDYARSLYRRFGYVEDIDSRLSSEIGLIAARAERRVDRVHSNIAQSSEREVEHHAHQHLETEAQREQVNQRPRPIQPKPSEGNFGRITFDRPDYLTVAKTSARQLLDSPLLTPAFFCCENQVLTGQVQDDSGSSAEILKPIDYIAIVRIEDGPNIRFEAHACSNETLSTDLDRLVHCPERVENLKHTVFLITAPGKRLVQRGGGALRPPDETVERILQSEWLDDISLDTALMRGRILDKQAWFRRIYRSGQGWDGFEALWNEILRRLPNPETADAALFEKMKKEYGAFLKSVGRSSSQEKFSSPLLSDHLFIYETDQVQNKPFKPIEYLAIVQINERDRTRWEARAFPDLSLEELEKMTLPPENAEDVNHTLFLVKADAKRVAKLGHGPLYPKKRDVESIMQGQWMHDLCLDTALMSGRILDKERWFYRIYYNQKISWATFESLWNEILRRLPNPETADIATFEAMKREYPLFEKKQREEDESNE